MKLDGGDSCRLSRWRLLIRKTIQATHGTRIPTLRRPPPPPLSHALESTTIIAAGSVSLKCRQVATVADAPRAKRLRHSSAFINI